VSISSINSLTATGNTPVHTHTHRPALRVTLHGDTRHDPLARSGISLLTREFNAFRRWWSGPSDGGTQINTPVNTHSLLALI